MFVVLSSCSESNEFEEIPFDFDEYYAAKDRFYENPRAFTIDGEITNAELLVELTDDSISRYGVKWFLDFPFYEYGEQRVSGNHRGIKFEDSVATKISEQGWARTYSYKREKNTVSFEGMRPVGYGISLNSLYYLMSDPQIQVDTVEETAIDEFWGVIKSDGLWVPGVNYITWGVDKNYFTLRGYLINKSVIDDPSVFLEVGDTLVLQKYWSIYQ